MKYICTGRIHPERADVWFDQCEVKSDGLIAVVSCDSSQITVVLEISSDKGEIAAYAARNIAENVANIVVGALGFSFNLGYSVEIIQVIEPDGKPNVFGVRSIGMESGQKTRTNSHASIFRRTLTLSARNSHFRMALQDYLRAINDMRDRPTYCYRAIEAIKSTFENDTESNQWNAMHLALGTDQATIENRIKQYADPKRHGNWKEEKKITIKEHREMLKLTREILIKYIDHAETYCEE